MFSTKKLVMVPGPVPVSASVLQHLGSETLAHSDPAFVVGFQKLLAELRKMVDCTGLAFLLSGSGTMGMEMAIANVTEEGDKVLVCSNGYFGDRYISICEKRGLKVKSIRAGWGASVTPEEVDMELSDGDYKAVVMTHVETSTGAELPLRAMAEMMQSRHPEIILVVDGVAAGGGVEVNMKWGIDVYFTSTQEAFCCVPGMVIIWAGKRALEKRVLIESLSESYIDFARWLPVMVDTKQYWSTPAVNNIVALEESVRILLEEGLEDRYERHRTESELVRNALASMGFSVMADEGCRAPTLSVFLYPEGMPVSDAVFREACSLEGAVVAGCMGEYEGKGFCMGHMGNLDKHMLISSVAAIERAALVSGLKIEPGAALAVVQRGLAGKR